VADRGVKGILECELECKLAAAEASGVGSFVVVVVVAMAGASEADGGGDWAVAASMAVSVRSLGAGRKGGKEGGSEDQDGLEPASRWRSSRVQ
jgi:hypothetical protein